jgi:signal transduction histidine kinase
MGLVFSPLLLLGGEWFLLTVQLPTVLALVAVVAATLRHRVFGIEVVVGRAFLYTTMLGLVALLYGAIVGLSTLLAGDAGAGASFLAAAVAAFALAPARGRLERVINHLLFGKRDEPYAVLSSVASRLEAAGAPEELLPEFTAHVQAALNVPYIAVEYGKGGDRRLISHGRESQQAERFPLTNHGAEIGALLVGPRNGERGFSQTEHDLLTNLARQASAAVANVVLTEDLKRSRERIVSAREEERRRLRRDLHDGLGPVLTGAAMMIDAGRNLIPTDPTTANEQFIEARAQVKGAIDDVRRLVYALRPPALDELGLVGALKEQFERGPVAVTIRTEGLLVELPAAVEVAAFRIISEAITNAARHSSATTCAIAINLNGALEIDIHDNGTSVTPWRPGVGMSSMRERAAELGGLCEIGPDSDGRGRVHAVLPVAVAS